MFSIEAPVSDWIVETHFIKIKNEPKCGCSGKCVFAAGFGVSDFLFFFQSDLLMIVTLQWDGFKDPNIALNSVAPHFLFCHQHLIICSY